MVLGSGVENLGIERVNTAAVALAEIFLNNGNTGEGRTQWATQSIHGDKPITLDRCMSNG